jgi:hypothetical protein
MAPLSRVAGSLFFLRFLPLPLSFLSRFLFSPLPLPLLFSSSFYFFYFILFYFIFFSFPLSFVLSRTRHATPRRSVVIVISRAGTIETAALFFLCSYATRRVF